MVWDAKKAVDHLQSNAQAASQGKCAHYVREAITAGGVQTRITHYAKDMGDALTSAGFTALPASSLPQAGDVAVIQPVAGHPAGHACMFDGKIWISDFKQLHGFYPGPAYRAKKPAYVIYRHR